MTLHSYNPDAWVLYTQVIDQLKVNIFIKAGIMCFFFLLYSTTVDTQMLLVIFIALFYYVILQFGATFADQNRTYHYLCFLQEIVCDFVSERLV